MKRFLIVASAVTAAVAGLVLIATTLMPESPEVGAGSSDRGASEGAVSSSPRSTADQPREGLRVVAVTNITMAAPELLASMGWEGAEDSGTSFVRKGLSWAFGTHSPDPSWSFDGSRIAYHDGVCITVRWGDGKLDKTIRGSHEGCRSPRWSHDGKRIIASHPFHGSGLLVDLEAGSQTEIAPRGDGLWSLSFSPDDRFLVGRVHQTGSVLVPVDATENQYALASEENPVMEGYFPSLSPTGRHAVRLLGEAWEKKGRLEILEVSELSPTAEVADPWEYKDTPPYPAVLGKRTTLVATPGPILETAWAPDGSRLAVLITATWYEGYDSYIYPQGQLMIVDVVTGSTRYTSAYGRSPTWSPDGRHIAFDRPGGGIWVLPTTLDREPWKIHPRGVEPRWSPKGDKVLVLDPDRGAGEILTLSG